MRILGTPSHIRVLFHGKPLCVRDIKGGHLTIGSEIACLNATCLSLRFWNMLDLAVLKSYRPFVSMSNWYFISNRVTERKVKVGGELQTTFSVVNKEPHLIVKWEMTFHENVFVKVLAIIFDQMSLIIYYWIICYWIIDRRIIYCWITYYWVIYDRILYCWILYYWIMY